MNCNEIESLTKSNEIKSLVFNATQFSWDWAISISNSTMDKMLQKRINKQN